MKRLPVRGKDLTGVTRGRLVVLYPVDDGKIRASRSLHWLCRCACGADVVASVSALTSGSTFSCGCLKREKAAASGRRSATHGLSGSPEYTAWLKMKDRCRNVDGWAGRGVEVCDRWSASFAAFYEDMGPMPSAKHSLDRYPDNDGNYEPGNVRWANRTEQNRNKRNNMIVTAFGRTGCLSSHIPWGSRTAIYMRMHSRIRRGADPEIAITAALLGR